LFSAIIAPFVFHCALNSWLSLHGFAGDYNSDDMPRGEMCQIDRAVEHFQDKKGKEMPFFRPLRGHGKLAQLLLYV
jgi:hypothetical protein